MFKRFQQRTRWLLIGLGGCAGLGLLATVVLLLLAHELPTQRAVQHPPLERATVLYSADGQEIARYYRTYRVGVGPSQIAPAVKQALIATEDRRFYEHGGVDGRRLLAAAVNTLWGDRQGASTITMQLARNLYPQHIGRAPTVWRKAKEMLTALWLEQHHTKREILALYLNAVPFGYNAFGIEAAARTYFSKHAAQLDTTESALLIGMLKGSSHYNPVRHPERARQRRNVVLHQMARRGVLSKAAFRQLRRRPLRLAFQRPSSQTALAPHFAEYVRRQLAGWAAEHGYDLYTDGLRLHTTLDSRLQTQAQQTVTEQMTGLQAVVDYEWSRPRDYFLSEQPAPYQQAKAAGRVEPFSYFWNTRRDLINQYVRHTRRYRQGVRAGVAPATALHRLRHDNAFMDSLRTAKTRLEAGLVAIDPNTGYVKAWVGSRDFSRDQYDKVAMARRQPGSTFKPFVYATALDDGFAPYDTVRDAVHHFALDAAGNTWTPRNVGGASGRPVTLRNGLVYSKNTVTAQLMARLGPHAVARTAERMGIHSPLREVPSLALGTSGVTLLELTSAYGSFATRGIRHPPVVVTRIEDHNGRLLASFGPQPKKVLSAHTAYTILDMMRGVIDRGTGARLRRQYDLYEHDLAGKTGTTQRSADGWFILMHPQLVTGAWVGFNDPRLTFRSRYWGQGGHNALHLAGAFYQKLDTASHAPLSRKRFRPPPGYRPPQPPRFATEKKNAYTAPMAGLDAGGYQRHPAPHARFDSLRSPTKAAAPTLRPAPVSPSPSPPSGQHDADVEQTLRTRVSPKGANPPAP